MSEEPRKKRIIVALDYSYGQLARAMANKLDPQQCALKIGKELLARAGLAIAVDLRRWGFDIFWDQKYYDIPNTVAGACRAVAEMGRNKEGDTGGLWMLNMHASGGREMMEAAMSALKEYGDGRPLAIAVTVLTSLDEEDLLETGVPSTPSEQVLLLARLAQDCGLDGVVCSPLEVKMLREELGKDFLLVTPGIRPVDSSADDQKRLSTPEVAIRDGSDHLVIGRPITNAPDPMAALLKIQESIRNI